VSTTPVITTHDTITIGSRRFGSGFDATLVTIDGEPFATTADGTYYSACGNCDGGWSGFKAHHAGLHAGQCFQCIGRGYRKQYPDQASAVKAVKRRQASRKATAARRAKKEAAEAAERAAAATAFRAEHPDLAATLDRVRDERNNATLDQIRAVESLWGGNLIDLAYRAERRGLTDKQIEFAAELVQEATDRVAARQAQRYLDADKADNATGTVAVAVTTENQYGLSRLLVIEGTGDYTGVTFKVWGTGRTLWTVNRGDTVTVTGAVKAREEYEGTMQTVLTRAKIEAV
jgi:hypothetical protein